MTTNTTNSQAASIDTPEFWLLLNAREEGAMDDAHAEELEQAIVKFIDAKLAQANQRADIAEAIVKDKVETILLYRQELKDLNTRTIAAESRLAEIQRGVEGLQRYEFRTGFKLDVPAAGILPTELGPYVMFEAVENLLNPQVKSDTGGLSG